MLVILITISMLLTIITLIKQEHVNDSCKRIIEEQSKKLKQYEKIIDKMAQDLTTDYHTKEWVIAHYMEEINE